MKGCENHTFAFKMQMRTENFFTCVGYRFHLKSTEMDQDQQLPNNSKTIAKGILILFASVLAIMAAIVSPVGELLGLLFLSKKSWKDGINKKHV